VTIVRSTVDTFVREDTPLKIFPNVARLNLGSPSGNTRRSFIFFSRPFPVGATVESAVLRVTLKEAWAGSHTIHARRIITKWISNWTRWENQPDTTATNAASEVVTGGVWGDVVEIDVSAMLQDVANGGAWYGIRLTLDGNDLLSLHSSDTPQGNAFWPQLDIDWSVPPPAPSRLQPSGGQVRGAEFPLLEWGYGVSGGAWENSGWESGIDQASSQVQISTSTDFTTPEYDSTMVANTDSQWDLADTAYAGVPDGATRYWRVRIQNGSGINSPWSNVAEFARSEPGVLALVSPGVGGEVNDTTPPISWTLTGATQTAAQVTLYELNWWGRVPVYEIWRMPRRATDETSVTLPSGYIMSGREYRIRVRVWDDADRVGAGGDPAFQQVERDFIYVRDATPDPVDDLAVELQPQGPGVIVTWTDTVEPDFYSVRVDGEEVMPRLEPADVRVEATDNFMLNLYRLSPGTEQNIEIERVVSTGGEFKHSDSDVVAITARAGMKYLVDETDNADIVVRLLGKEPADLSVGETGETFNLVGSRIPVRIVDSQRGYEGTVIGTMEDTAMRREFRRMKDRNTVVRYIQGTLNVPVILGEASVTPSPDYDMHDLSVEIFQVGEFFRPEAR